VARYLGDGLPGSCTKVVLAHLSLTNNHPELARMAAETALGKRGRTDVRLELPASDGTDWLEAGRADGGDRPSGQMRLW